MTHLCKTVKQDWSAMKYLDISLKREEMDRAQKGFIRTIPSIETSYVLFFKCSW